MIGERIHIDQLHTLRDDAPEVLLEASMDVASGTYSSGSFAYDANGNMILDLSRDITDMEYNALNLPCRATFADGSHIDWLYNASGEKLRQTVIAATGDILSRRDYLGPYLFVDNKFDRYQTAEGYITPDDIYHAYIPDYQGNIVGVVNTSSGILEQHTRYYPYGLPFADSSNPTVNRRKYGAKELTTNLGLNAYDFEARTLVPAFPMFSQQDPPAEKYYPLSPYLYCAGNPINLVDPTGEEPVYNTKGEFLGNTSEGFTGDILIYLGSETIDFKEYTRTELEKAIPMDIDMYDNVRMWGSGGMSEESHSKIWTHVVSQFEEQMIYDERFSLSRIAGGKIGYETNDDEDIFWQTKYSSNTTPTIHGTGNYDYESTVENLASTILVHEWYSHGVKNNGDKMKSHRLAYKNVINFNPLWDKTTDKFKEHNLINLLYYTIKETGREKLDKPYRNLFNIYVKQRP